ncbi:hypothetical protein FACS1894166_10910 [Bacilli bacterium]|nr:hypothetical protein FACS1894166_10910 [Bacilli bacterium]
MKAIQLKIGNKTMQFDNLAQVAIYTVNQITESDIEAYLDKKYGNLPTKKYKSGDAMLSALKG